MATETIEQYCLNCEDYLEGEGDEDGDGAARDPEFSNYCDAGCGAIYHDHVNKTHEKYGTRDDCSECS